LKNTEELTRKIFSHQKIDLGYEDLITESTTDGRKYVTPSGIKYPSITTVLGHFTKHEIQAWRNRVGEEEANKISTRAASRGTSLHSICERYIDNEVDYFKEAMPHVRGMFNTIKSILDERVGSGIHARSASLLGPPQIGWKSGSHRRVRWSTVDH